MAQKIIDPVKRISGRIVLPGDKSISHRALIIGSIAKGTTRITNILECDDCARTTDAFRLMGVEIDRSGAQTLIRGAGLRGLKQAPRAMYMGESGTSIRLLAGLLAGQDFSSRLECAPSLSKRPMHRIESPLSLMGASIDTAPGGLPPLAITGKRLKPISYKMPVASAQVKSAVLLAGLYADGKTTVCERVKTRDHTERMLRYFGAKVSVRGGCVLVTGPAEMKARTLEIPCDISSAAFFMVAATVLDGSKVTIPSVCINPTRSGIIDVMKKMGASIKISNRRDIFEPTADVTVSSAPTRGIAIPARDVPSVIDELPVIFVLAALSAGKTTVRGSGELRVKETDRIASMKYNLAAMGVRFEEKGEDITIYGCGGLKGAALKSFGDHRTCMACAVAAIAAEGRSSMDDISCVGKSFPDFFGILEKAGDSD